MSVFQVTTFDINIQDVSVCERELKNRLGVDRDFDVSVYRKITETAFNNVQPCCVYTKVPVKCTSDGICDLGFTAVKSHDLCKNLKGCSSAFVFAVTLGIQAQRHLLTLSKTSQSSHFICDAYYNALAEAVCDKAEGIIKGSLVCKPRFSPGYGDLPLEIQRDVLNVLDAAKTAGICLTDSLLMTPQKSITAIMGIKDS